MLGGLLSNFLGFRSIFIFLLILSSLVLVCIVVFLPETMRSIAGDGSLRLEGIYQPLIYRFGQEPAYLRDPNFPVRREKVTLMTFVAPLKLLARKEVLFNLIFGGVVYAIWSMVTSSTTSLFKENFGLNELLLGVAFLPNGTTTPGWLRSLNSVRLLHHRDGSANLSITCLGFGTILGSTIIGKLMTRDYATVEQTYNLAHGLPASKKLSAKEIPADFPIEQARLRNLPWITVLFIVSTALYGFSLAFPALTSLSGWIAVPLTLQFLIAGTSNAIFALNQTLVSDLCPGKGASSTAINNLVRCSLGALGVAFIETMIAAVGPGPAFLGLAMVTIASLPLPVVTWFWGMEWRTQKRRTLTPGEKV